MGSMLQTTGATALENQWAVSNTWQRYGFKTARIWILSQEEKNRREDAPVGSE
jgi:hypothetical protein